MSSKIDVGSLAVGFEGQKSHKKQNTLSLRVQLENSKKVSGITQKAPGN